MSQTPRHIVIIGAGQAGSQAAQALRKRGFDGAITMLGDENAPPYQRPPLSKAYLKGELESERLYFRPQAFYGEHNITLRTGVRANSLDRQAQTVLLNTGETISYDALIIATGSRPRSLPTQGGDLDGVVDLRTLADADTLRERLSGAKHLTIIGAGYIGLEAAASARALGVAVTVIERAERCLARVTSPVMSDFFARLHASHGVDLRCCTDVVSIRRRTGLLTRDRLDVATSNGATIDTDLVLAGIGVIPNDDMAQAAGLACDGGIIVDEHARTSDPHIFAAGDCTVRPLDGRDGLFRLESVHNALEQGEQAAAALTQQDRPTPDTPWFWSDQYDIKLQTAGLSAGYTDIVVRGADGAKAAPFAAFYFRDAHLLAVDAVNDPPSFLVAKQMIKRSISPNPESLRDLSIPLKSLLN